MAVRVVSNLLYYFSLSCCFRVCSEERYPLPTCWLGAVSPSRNQWLWLRTAQWRGKQWRSSSSSRPTWETVAPRLTPSLWLWRSVYPSTSQTHSLIHWSHFSDQLFHFLSCYFTLVISHDTLGLNIFHFIFRYSVIRTLGLNGTNTFIGK